MSNVQLEEILCIRQSDHIKIKSCQQNKGFSLFLFACGYFCWRRNDIKFKSSASQHNSIGNSVNFIRNVTFADYRDAIKITEQKLATSINVLIRSRMLRNKQQLNR